MNIYGPNSNGGNPIQCCGHFKRLFHFFFGFVAIVFSSYISLVSSCWACVCLFVLLGPLLLAMLLLVERRRSSSRRVPLEYLMELNGQPVAQDRMRADVRHISTEKREERGRGGGRRRRAEGGGGREETKQRQQQKMCSLNGSRNIRTTAPRFTGC